MENKIKPSKPVQNYLFVIPSILGVIIFYTWFVSAGSGYRNGTTTYYYAQLAGTFLQGNLHLTMKPDPYLLALDNPYDPLARKEIEELGIVIPVDFSFFQGKYYMYWGPVPALLLATLQLFSNEPIGDFVLAFTFSIGIFLTQSLLLIAIWDRYFYTLPKWALHLSILLIGSTLPIALLRHYDDYARIYEAAIAGGQFFLISGLWVAFTAINKPSIPNWRLALAGLLWALGIGTRHILAVPIGFFIMLTAFWLVRINASIFEKTAKFISLGLPLALACVGLGWYNWARFGSIAETGLSFALAGVNLRDHSAEIFSSSYVFPNLYNYLLNPPALISKFPYISMLQGSENPILLFYAVPEFYYAQQITGLLYLFPFGVFAAGLLFVFFLNLFQGKLAKILLEGNNYRSLAWIKLMLSGAFLIAFLPLTAYFWVGTRFLGDFIPAMTILSAVGFWLGYQFSAHKPFVKRLYILFGIILAGVSILISTLLAISTDAGLIDLIVYNFPLLN
jgi:hypothetical protein